MIGRLPVPLNTRFPSPQKGRRVRPLPGGSRKRAPPPTRDPGGEGRVFDAALHGESRRAEAAGLEGVEHLALVLGGVTVAAGAVALDDGAGGGIGLCFHGPGPYRNRAAVG